MNTKVKQISESDVTVIAEYRLLNAIALNPSNIYKAGIDKELFIHDICKSYFESIEHLQKENIPITSESIYQYASGLDVNTSLESIKNIMSIQSDANVEVKDMIETLQTNKLSMEAVKLMDDIELIVNTHPIRSDEIQDDISEKLSKVQQLLLSSLDLKRTETFEEAGARYLEEFNERKLGKKYLFHDKILDSAITYGPSPGNGTLICAATGMGKSAFALNLINRLVTFEVPTMLYTLEMGTIDTFDRLVSIRTGIPMSEIVNPKDGETWLSIKKSIEKELEVLKGNKLFRVSECASISLAQLKQDIIKFQNEIRSKYCIVIIDLISMVKEFMITDKGGVNFAQGIEVAVNILNAMAKELGFHWMGTLQLGRKAEEGIIDDINDIQKFRPKRTDIKNSNSYLERCRASISLFRPKYYAECYLAQELYEDMTDIVEVSLMKQNQGHVGVFGKYLFDGETMTMTPLEEEDLATGEE